MFSFEVLDNGQVLKVVQDGNATVKTFHSMFYEISLAADKTTISAAAAEFATITATVKDYTGKVINTLMDITFLIGDTEAITQPLIDGKATFELEAVNTGDYVVTAIAPKGSSIEEVVIHATA